MLRESAKRCAEYLLGNVHFRILNPELVIGSFEAVFSF